jgi:predicted membrane protein
VSLVIALAVLLGAPAYLVALLLVTTLRYWLGQDAAGWLRAVVNGLLMALGAISAIYLVTLVNVLVPPSDLRITVTRYVLAVTLSLVPYFIILALAPWWLGRRRSPGGEQTALTPHLIEENDA